MTFDSLKQNISTIRNLINSNKLTESFSRLESIAYEENNFNILDSLKLFKQTYGYLIHYFMQGANDPSRVDVFKNIKLSLLDICDELLFERQIAESSAIFFSTARICRHRKISFNTLWHQLNENSEKISLMAECDSIDKELYLEKDSLWRQFFDYIWTQRFNKDLCDEILQSLKSEKADRELINLAISAMTLSLLGSFDKFKYQTLLDIYDTTDNDTIAAMAMVGIVLATERHSIRINEDKGLLDRLGVWQDSLITYSRLKTVIKEIIRTRDTDRVTAKMRDEVIPELMKLRPDMLKKMRDSAMDFETGMLDNNPEWEEMLEKNGIADKMRELTEMQSEGADLLMVTFSNLKGFPFFQNTSSWFMPYSSTNPAISMNPDFLKSLDAIFSLGANICDSDKYSLVLAFSTMAEQQRNLMFGQFEQQLSQIAQETNDRLVKQSDKKFSITAVSFIRELYRFFKLFRRKTEFDDPFIRPLNFLSLPVIGEMLADDDVLSVVGEFYFKRGFYREALDLFKTMEQNYSADHTYWEKVGYAFQSIKEYDKALDAYNKSSLLSEPGQWLLNRIAHVNKKLGNFKAAAEFYAKALDNDPDNVSLLMNTGNSLLECGNPGRALGFYYHADYLDPDNIKIKRAVAWGELVSGNFEKSSQLYEKILQSSLLAPEHIDLLNAGHAKLAAGVIDDAISLYRKAYKLDPAKFEQDFTSDYQILRNLNIDDLTLTLILESLLQ